ncbi:DUF4326 domain-containing protein [Agromyces sp. G08B096]|uniref:DUF4326 domain-containing protein n=1 Tax=Agromyces sp. G08B096 TaxID=3156399 RepID=A0AAU7W3F0_9MICO
MPERIQLSRRKGWRKPENTVVVARPSKWGNPFKITHEHCDEAEVGGMCWVVRRADRRPAFAHESTVREARAVAVEEFRTYLRAGLLSFTVEGVRAELAGKNLACWCPLDQPCHADVLLEIANESGT